MAAKEEFQDLFDAVIEIRAAIKRLQKYKSNTYYRNQLDRAALHLNRRYRFISERIKKAKQPALSEKFGRVNDEFRVLVSESEYSDKLKAIERIEIFWPEIEIELDSTQLQIKSFEIPPEIPMTEYRLDLEEAIKNFDGGCYISALVLCRRSYEGALVDLFRMKTKGEPVERTTCKHCKAEIRAKAYMGIGKLHAWAIENKHVTDKLKQVGFLLSDMGAGAAHPPLSEFSRDPELARLGITATIALLKEVTKQWAKK